MSRQASVSKSSYRTVSSQQTGKSINSKLSNISKDNLLCISTKQKDIVKAYCHPDPVTPEKKRNASSNKSLDLKRKSKIRAATKEKALKKVIIKESDEEDYKEEPVQSSSQKKAAKIAMASPYAPPKMATPFRQFPPIDLFYWNPNSLGTLQQGNPSIKRELIEAEKSHFVFLVEPYHHYTLPGYETQSGTTLKDKKKIYAQVLWRKELPVEVILSDVDLIVIKMNFAHLTNPLYMFCVYLSHTDSRRIYCLNLIMTTIEKVSLGNTSAEDKPLFLMVGDFNKNLLALNSYSRDPSEKILNQLMKQFIAALDMKHNDITRERVILNGKKVERSRIDWMLMSKYGLKVQSTVVKDSMQWSDHFAFNFKIDL